MTAIRREPCSACPYRQDVPSGVWETHEYDKLRPYDNPSGSQPFAGFACHATPDHFCHGWAVVHTSRGHEFDLIALRFDFEFDGDIPEPSVPLFASGADAADHGQADINVPSPAARATMARLTRKYPRLNKGGENG